MIDQRRQWFAIILVSQFIGATVCFADDSLVEEGTNAFCPVMPEMEALPEISLRYGEHTVRFCCIGCRREFLADPEKYLPNLPHIASPGFVATAWELMGRHNDLMMIGSLVLGLVWLRTARSRWSTMQLGDGVASLLTRTVSPTVPLLVLLIAAGYEINLLSSALFYQAIEEDIHFATFYDYGMPAKPTPPKHGPRLAGTYYRGNDERSPLLLNGGNYRTATFHIALVDDQDRPISYGQQLTQGPIYLRLRIDRPKFTPDFLYSDRFMKAIFLTQEHSASLGRDAPVADRVPLTELKKMWRWEARYPIAQRIADDAEFEGVAYVCEDKFYQPHRFAAKDQIGGGRFHYGMPFRLVLRDGKVAEESELSMGSLYRTRKFPIHEVPLDQWFSEQPIPELAEKNTEDPTLLGIEDYLSP